MTKVAAVGQADESDVVGGVGQALGDAGLVHDGGASRVRACEP